MDEMVTGDHAYITMNERLQALRKKIQVRGVVQGVGFRPFVYRLAHRFNLDGWVYNTSWGVEIEIEGPCSSLDGFLRALTDQTPPLACIESVTAEDIPPNGQQPFAILESRSQKGAYQLISPDVATCHDCLREVFDSTDRRYRYPFTNCTNCGPRFTIITDIPYDRPSTTMRHFIMCPACQAEYDDPLDRRFHAQPNACRECGPRVWLVDAQGDSWPARDIDVIEETARLLSRGHVLALKGLGGFHLACDATNDEAIQLLRERKRRPTKPMAVMMATLEEVRRHCDVSPGEKKLLTSHQCPIVLLRKRGISSVSPLVAPANRYLGVMLPYTPLHHILLREVGRPLVMTSGNLSEEPIASDNDEALQRLGHLADYFLMHDREIHARYDDSVWLVSEVNERGGRATGDITQTTLAQPIRRSRGYAPYPIRLPFRVGQTLACGAELKNTFCITRENYAFLSQHIGDMENLETLEHFETSIRLFQRLFRIEPEIIAHDMHPDYLSTRYALQQTAVRERAIKLIAVQHHHAHIASCLAENGWVDDEPVIGVAFDGTGYGLDGHIWGGEFLLADYRGFTRVGHLEYLPMPGGETAIRNPYRLALGYLYALTGEVPVLPFVQDIPEEELRIIPQQVERGLNTPLTSSVGRLFDAVSAMLDVCPRTSYEAQAAIALEMAADDRWQGTGYPFNIEGENDGWQVGLAPMFASLVDEIKRGTPTALISARFHKTIVQFVAAVCERIRKSEGVNTVALSGGCFQNRILLGGTVAKLQAGGFTVLAHHQVPCNDGGLSLGQAVIANFTAPSSGEHSLD